MKVTVIGTSGSYPTKDNPTSSYLVSTEGANILLDCGSGSMMRLDNLTDLEELHNVFISHKHPDHIADLGVLQHRRLVQKNIDEKLPDLSIFGSFEEMQKAEIATIAGSRVYDLKGVDQIGPFTVRFQKTIHPVEAYAIRLEIDGKSIVYTSDTAYSEELCVFSENVDLLITESSLYPGFDGSTSGHMNINEAIRFSKKSNAKKVILSHLPEYGPFEAMQTALDKSGLKNISFAKPNMTIRI